MVLVFSFCFIGNNHGKEAWSIMTAKVHLVNNNLVAVRTFSGHLIPSTVTEFSYLPNSCFATAINKTLIFFKYQA